MKNGLNIFTEGRFRLPRRGFLKAGAALLAASGGGALAWRWAGSRRPATPAGAVVGAASSVGHLLREGKFPAPKETRRSGIVIVGGGISGLSAGWRLNRRGFEDFTLLELESETGGNSRGGRNPVSAYPWGAHYLPLPGPDSKLVLELLQELGVIEGHDAAGLPIYNEFHLCQDPQERLYIEGRWQEGLVPATGLVPEDRRQLREFFAAMEEFRRARGPDGRRAFAIPLEESSRERKFRELDRISMARFLLDRGWNSEALKWYVNYCCRDDYGSRMEDVSAWAGIHYFASRAGTASNAPAQSVLTWPEGNAWLAGRLREKIGERARTSALVFSIAREGRHWAVDHLDVNTGQAVRTLTDTVIYAAPRFTAPHVIRGLPEERVGKFQYAPWMVANLTLRSHPGGRGAGLSWDNVSYRSPSLGYIVATHQETKVFKTRETVLTYYLPLSERDPATERRTALARSHAEWAELILRDLSEMHPGIREDVARLDVWLWGHAMIRPAPGFIWGEERREALKPHDGIFFAHSDMSGISIFEEAQFRGVEAADGALALLKAAEGAGA